MRASAVTVLLLAGCDPAPGSLAECEPASAAVPLETISDVVPPVTNAELQAWLAGDGYAAYLPESGVHDSTSSHGGRVRTFVNRQLAGSLTTCAGSHPIGAAAVKELHGSSGVRGWAVMVKTEDGAGADRWFWYEVFSTSAAAAPAHSGQANEVCTGCHDGGLDAVRTRWPLQ